MSTATKYEALHYYGISITWFLRKLLLKDSFERGLWWYIPVAQPACVKPSVIDSAKAPESHISSWITHDDGFSCAVSALADGFFPLLACMDVSIISSLRISRSLHALQRSQYSNGYAPAEFSMNSLWLRHHGHSVCKWTKVSPGVLWFWSDSGIFSRCSANHCMIRRRSAFINGTYLLVGYLSYGFVKPMQRRYEWSRSAGYAVFFIFYAFTLSRWVQAFHRKEESA